MCVLSTGVPEIMLFVGCVHGLTIIRLFTLTLCVFAQRLNQLTWLTLSFMGKAAAKD